MVLIEKILDLVSTGCVDGKAVLPSGQVLAWDLPPVGRSGAGVCLLGRPSLLGFLIERGTTRTFPRGDNEVWMRVARELFDDAGRSLTNMTPLGDA